MPWRVILGSPTPRDRLLPHQSGRDHDPCAGNEHRAVNAAARDLGVANPKDRPRPISPAGTTTTLIWAGNTIPAWGDEYWAVAALRDPRYPCQNLPARAPALPGACRQPHQIDHATSVRQLTRSRVGPREIARASQSRPSSTPKSRCCGSCVLQLPHQLHR